MPEAIVRGADAAPQLDEARAFEEQLTMHGRDGLRLARWFGHSPQDAADVVQEAAILAWRYRATRHGEWRPWFFAIVRRVASRQKTRWTLIPVSWRAAETPIDEGFFGVSDVAIAMARLPARQRAAVWLRFGEDLAYRDVSRVLGVREAAAKMLVSRGRAALRRAMSTQL